MYYHMIVQLKNKEYLNSKNKQNKDDIINKIVLPYVNKAEFIIDSKMVNFKDIDKIWILESEYTFEEIVKQEESKYDDIYLVGIKDEELVINSNKVKNILEELIDKNINLERKVKININNKKIFLVHGRDEEMKQTVARFLEKLELNPIILHEQPSMGKTIIEQIEKYTDVGFGIVLYSSDDEGRLKGKELKPRARQNVVFEHGYLVGKLGRNRVIAIIKETNIDLPSDLNGLIYLNFNNNWQIALGKELKKCSFEIDMNKIIE